MAATHGHWRWCAAASLTLALIDGIPIIIRNQLPEHVTGQQIIARVKAVLWERIEDQRNERVFIARVQAYVRVADLEDVFAYLIGPRKDQ